VRQIGCYQEFVTRRTVNKM